MNDDSVEDFVLHLAFDAGVPKVAVLGDLDIATAASLAGVLNALIPDGYRELIVDLGGLTFMGAQGVSVLAQAARRATAAGGTLTIQSVPAMARRIFDITKVGELVIFETPPPAHSTLGPEEGARDNDRLAPIDETEASVLADAQHALVRSSIDVIDAALRLVTALTDATVDNADGVSVTLERHGQLMTVAASNEAVLTMDRHQYETGEGPCLDAKTQGRWFYSESLAEETRWPAFVPLALGQGIRSILSSPLMTRDRPQGALNIYSSTKHAFGTHEQELAALFAAQASEILTTAGHDITDEASNRRFAAALSARKVIHQAQGVIMACHDLTGDAANGELARQARKAGITVLARAIEVVASPHAGDGPG